MATTLSPLTLAVVLLCAGTCPGQIPSGRISPAPLRVEVNLVLVPVTVTDKRGKSITDLDGSRFKILDEGVPRPIASFSTEDLPASIGVVLDISGSMRQKLTAARSFLRALLAGTQPTDEALLLTCTDRPDVQMGLTHDIDRVESILQSTRPGGWTALVDSIYVTIDRIKSAHNSRKVLVIVSDGQDNRSRHSKRELLSRAIESEAQIYAVATCERPGNRKAIELVEENQGKAFLADLAHTTGGLYFEIDSAAPISAVAERISRTLHHQYLIGYYPTAPLNNGLRRIQVKLDVPDVRVYARNLYHATLPQSR